MQKRVKSIATAEFLHKMAEMRMAGTVITLIMAQELAENESVKECIQCASDGWVQSLANVLEKIIEDRSSKSTDVSSESLTRGIIALRGGL